MWFGSNSIPQFIGKVKFGIYRHFLTHGCRPEMVTMRSNGFGFAARSAGKRMMGLAVALSWAQGPPWSLPCSMATMWVEEEGEYICLREEEEKRSRDGAQPKYHPFLLLFPFFLFNFYNN